MDRRLLLTTWTHTDIILVSGPDSMNCVLKSKLFQNFITGRSVTGKWAILSVPTTKDDRMIITNATRQVFKTKKPILLLDLEDCTDAEEDIILRGRSRSSIVWAFSVQAFAQYYYFTEVNYVSHSTQDISFLNGIMQFTGGWTPALEQEWRALLFNLEACNHNKNEDYQVE